MNPRIMCKKCFFGKKKVVVNLVGTCQSVTGQIGNLSLVNIDYSDIVLYGEEEAAYIDEHFCFFIRKYIQNICLDNIFFPLWDIDYF